ncbi:hypothetical protein KAFR_0G01850 [Kazachstania africana CBS 2517]|uniref:DSC E3 ubiquitin ligase complex subunit 3 C-terminal domain-containing protein n=1 Tax=Kazachstania africana (strain ATCC 22294 / BCRC 22015 / CBS 2517 / CECT 1963 / NBRC 1671 / NRRL Y-8276) TaxID=1071382 RepID=H2AXW9_KAZAF|nr:hypothetical protein KAFR_0G01850 [Kazachstania africana CBS 2517]CCF59219.1 hypothetical protein KAFR_0G01850 [Kazachstania africana CBS 2517]
MMMDKDSSTQPLLPTHDEVCAKIIKVVFTDDRISPISLNITKISPVSKVTIIWLRKMIRELKPSETKDHALRFLKSGTIISASAFNEQIISYINSTNADAFFIHCMIGVDELSSEEVLHEEQNDDSGRLNNVNNGTETMGAIGFDRLRSIGFSDEEIELLRSQFRSTYGDVLQNNDVDEGNDVDGSGGESDRTSRRNIRELEEQWMENGAGDNDERFNSVPIANFKHNKDLLVGLCVGFCFGIFAIILWKIDGLFNKRQRYCLVAGMIINIMFCLVRGF